MFRLLYLLFFVLFFSCNPVFNPNKIPVAVSEVYTVKEDPSILKIIEPYKIELEDEMSEILGVTAYELPKGKPECLLSNFLADSILEECKKVSEDTIDFCVLNYGGLRLPGLPEGNISKRLIYELLPFDNYMSVLELDKATLQEFFDHIAAKGGWPVSKEVAFKLDTVLLKASNITINGQKIDRKDTYKVVMPDYIANGGDQCSMLKPVAKNNLTLLLREAMLNYLYSNIDTISPGLDNRIYYE